MQKRVSVKNKSNESLAGFADYPVASREKYPTVILVHGFGTDKTEGGMFDELANTLTNTGFLVYRFDFSGLGKSEGDYSKTSLSKLVGDLRTIVDFVKTQPQVETSKLGAVGLSLGTSVLIALNAPEVKIYVLLGSIIRPYEVLKNLCEPYSFNPNGISFRITPRGRRVELGPQFWKDLSKYDLLKLISVIRKPVCVIHGEKDTKVPLADAEALYKAAKSPKKIVVIKNAGHGAYRPEERKQIIDETVSWFQKFLA